MSIRIEIRSPAPDQHVTGAIRRLGFSVEAVHRIDVFHVDGTTEQEAERLATEALCDDVVESVQLHPTARPVAAIEVAPKPGVTDSRAETLVQAAHLLGIDVGRASTATRYEFSGAIAQKELAQIATQLLANDVVQVWSDGPYLPPSFPEGESPHHVIETLAVRGVDDAGLTALSNERRLALDVSEMRCIRTHFEELGRDPTDLELEMLAQTWSEHCVHKTFRAHITVEEQDVDGNVLETRIVDDMFDSFLKVPTRKVAKDWVVSAFVDNAGIVRFDENFDVALKVETHNHPSALEPFGGANTGIGGCVRDILGVSARPIANTDVLCFGPAGQTDLPAGVLTPERIQDGVIAGIEDYGNKMGIPTVAGAIVYDTGYTANPLVYAGCLGILPHGSHPTAPRAGDRVVVLGGRTGRDGLRGATFSSMEMSQESNELAGSAVQIGHPINEKQVQEVVCEARDQGLYTAITDCGAGGLSSSIGEMASKLGATVHLERAPTKYPGLQPWEVWLSEAQERMVLAVPDESWDALSAVCARHGVEAVTLGRMTGDGILTVMHEDAVVGQLQCDFLHDGLPQRTMRATVVRSPIEPVVVGDLDIEATLLSLLSSDNLCSREATVRRYDHEVQGGTVVKPLVGIEGHGPGNGSVLVPMAARNQGRLNRGVALGCGINPWYGQLDPYRMAVAVIDEAVRNVVVMGADPEQLSLVDNFCWGNPNLPDRLGALVRCGEGCRDAALTFDAPYVSGKDSLNNEYATPDGHRQPIPGTLLITAMAMVPEVAHTATSDVKAEGQDVWLVGTTNGELGGSAMLRHLGTTGDEAPRPVEDALKVARAVHAALRTGQVSAAHDLSEGGLLVALAEMALGGRVGMSIDLESVPGPGLTLARTAFGESSSRYLLTAPLEARTALQGVLASTPHAIIGSTGGDTLHVSQGSTVLLDTGVAELEAAHRRI